MKDETEKNIKLYLHVYFILISTFIIVGLLSVVYLPFIQNNLALLSAINVALITMLVLINGAYGYFTWQIVDETRNDRRISQIERKIEFTEHKLRDFYYPLENFLKRYFSYEDKTNSSLHVNFELHNTGTRNNLLGYENVIKCKYLATKDIQDNLSAFLDEKILSREKITAQDILLLYDGLITDVETDIQNLNDKSSNLIEELAGY